MTGVTFSLIMAGVLLNAIAQLLLKASVSEVGSIGLTIDSAWPITHRLISEPWLWLGLCCYGVSVIVWILALSRVDVSIAYPMLSIGYVVNAFMAWWLLGESLGYGKLAGIGIIIIGVIVLARS
ncbi:EamA family transporter [Microbulbifer sp. SAOS-129_SWC]|uniref:EamA family transporter n=1 Tax=Microbulbifer sp. SAOS-129_SWC TaxID=3145235 RepID=UPI003217A60C